VTGLSKGEHNESHIEAPDINVEGETTIFTFVGKVKLEWNLMEGSA
jgi:hypothetical protein